MFTHYALRPKVGSSLKKQCAHKFGRKGGGALVLNDPCWLLNPCPNAEYSSALTLRTHTHARPFSYKLTYTHFIPSSSLTPLPTTAHHLTNTQTCTHTHTFLCILSLIPGISAQHVAHLPLHRPRHQEGRLEAGVPAAPVSSPALQRPQLCPSHHPCTTLVRK